MAPNSNITGDDLVITSITAKDMRWPTSLGGHGSDAMVIIFIKTTQQPPCYNVEMATENNYHSSYCF